MLLAIETATHAGSVALMSEGRVDRVLWLPGAREHARLLAPTVAEILGEGLPRLEHYALTIGPGSFTGLRIGLSLIKGMALVHPRPAVPVSTLELIAEKGRRALGATTVLALLDPRAGELYAGLFRWSESRWTVDPALEEGLYPLEELRLRLGELGEPVLVGEGVEALSGAPGQLPEEVWRPDAGTLAELAWSRLRSGLAVEVQSLEPRYLQRSAAERKRARALAESPGMPEN